MNITLTSTTGTIFTIFSATDRNFFMKTPGNDLVYCLPHGCTDGFPCEGYARNECYESVHSLGLIKRENISAAWEEVLLNYQFFTVSIMEYVGDMEFPKKTICAAPSLREIWQSLDEKMASYRGDGVFIKESDMWDYGETMACINDVQLMDRNVVKYALMHNLMTLWIWVS